MVFSFTTPLPFSSGWLSLTFDKIEIVPDWGDRVVVLPNVLIRARQHDWALHGRQDKGGNGFHVGLRRQAILRSGKKRLDHPPPGIEQHVQFFSSWPRPASQLESEISDR